MKNVWAWVAAVVVSVCILGLLVSVRPSRQEQRAAYWTTTRVAQQTETKMPPRHWLVIRQIPHP